MMRHLCILPTPYEYTIDDTDDMEVSNICSNSLYNTFSMTLNSRLRDTSHPIKRQTPCRLNAHNTTNSQGTFSINPKPNPNHHPPPAPAA